MATKQSNIKDDHHYHWHDILQLIFKHKRELMIANFIAIIATLIMIPIPLLIPLLVDEVLLHKPGWLVASMNQWFPSSWIGPVFYIVFITLMTLIMRVVAMLLLVLQTREFTFIAKNITYRLRHQLLSHIQTVSMRAYETLGSGTVSARFMIDMETIDQFIGVSVGKFIVAVFTLSGITLVLLWLHWQLAVFILLLNPIVIFFTIKLGKKVKILKKKENISFEIFQQALTETLDAIQQIRASNREQHFFNHVSTLAKNIKHHSGHFSWQSDAANRFSFLIFLSGFDIFRAISMLMVLFSGLSIGEMLAVFSYLWFMMTPVQEVLNIQYSWFASNAALQRINQLFELETEAKYPHKQNPFQAKKTVSVTAKNITFRYHDRQDYILNHINLNIHKGEKIALVGASGGGKSTFVQVLLGLYPPQSGMIYFDNIPITEIGLDIVRENVATVLQHPALFNDTIRQNLTLGKTFDESKIWQALQIAQLDNVVQHLEQGLATLVGKQGIRLSGGQRQRLAIARMILSNPKVVILDEATSALDTETENKLHQALDQFLQSRTTLIIAHRLSAIRQADRILVFENGCISEQGNHNELLQQKGLYHRLYG